MIFKRNKTKYEAQLKHLDQMVATLDRKLEAKLIGLENYQQQKDILEKNRGKLMKKLGINRYDRF